MISIHSSVAGRYNLDMPESVLQAVMQKQDQAHYSAVGKVAVEWTRFESYVAEMVRMLAQVDNKFGECITSQIVGFARLLDALCALVDLRRPGAADNKSFKCMVDEIQSIAERRNRVVHDYWTIDPGVTNRWSTTVRKRYRPGPTQMSTAQIEKLADEIKSLSEEFLTYRRSFLMSINLWPGQ